MDLKSYRRILGIVGVLLDPYYFVLMPIDPDSHVE